MKPGRKRALVDAVRREWQVSTRKACQALEVDRSTYHYKSRRPSQATLSHLDAGSGDRPPHQVTGDDYSG